MWDEGAAAVRGAVSGEATGTGGAKHHCFRGN